jgi:endosialidase-like protein
LTVVPHAAGAVDYVSLWPAGSAQPFVATLNDPQGMIVANAAIVPAGSSSGGVTLYNAGPAATDVIIDMNGYFAAPTDMNENTAVGVGTLSNTIGGGNTASGAFALGNNYIGSFNTASGYQALQNNTAGDDNTANGVGALEANTTGSENTASGASALIANTTGGGNTAHGFLSLASTTSGGFNTASGVSALQYNTIGGGNTASGYQALLYNVMGEDNVAVGVRSLFNNSAGYDNTAIGPSALLDNTTGNFNIAIGFNAASNVSASNSNNIHIGSQGASSDSGTIRIGASVAQTSFFVAGVSGTTTGLSDAVPVVIDSNGQLGTMSSSQRFKDDIQDMGEASSGLMRLRPVTFRYKQPYHDRSKPIDYGLIAEEVAEVYPDLVAHSPDGQIQTVQYQKVNAMLLNEVQKQHQQIEQQKEEMTTEISALKARLADLEKQIE